jgi:ATP-dependent helicase/nuclease subunit A
MSEEPLRLENAQRAIRDAYFAHDSGLFTLDCVPGSGKSTVCYHLAAEDLLRRYLAGDRTPERHVAVVSFSRGEAASIVPEVCDRLRAIVEHDLVPAADRVSDAELERLIARIRRAPYAGTIDGVLREVFSSIADDIGFDGMPAVGNAARLKRIHATCYETIRADPEIESRLCDLEDAYPAERYADGVREMLESAVSHCRDRRLSTAEFRRELERTAASVYPDGPPESFADVVDAVGHHVGTPAEERRRGGTPEADRDRDDPGTDDRFDDVDGETRHRLVEADARLHAAWRARLDDFGTVLEAYRAAYRDAVRERGVVSHTDVAYLVDAYFDGRIDDVGIDVDVDDADRIRIRRRYRTRIRSLIVDEAQDVSAIQHAALSRLVTSDARVFVSGDPLQSIYGWRHADPSLFRSAIADGAYLGIDWGVHEHRTATTTYRCRPDVAAAIDAIAEPALTDPARGDVGDMAVAYPGLDPDRDSTDGNNVHVAAFEPMGADSDSHAWIDPVEGRGEAAALATFVSKGLADGTFLDDAGDPLDIVVLFRWSTWMDAYADAFAEAGLRVRNASEPLFACPLVEAVLDVCAWLVAPASPDRTIDLFVDSPLGLEELESAIRSADGEIGAVRAECAPTSAQKHVLDALSTLRDRRDRTRSRPATTYVEDVIAELALRADPHGLFPEVDPERRVGNLDALVDTLSEWEAEERLPPRELATLAAPFRENPSFGPNQPSTAGTDPDVEFRTIHDVKGDEADVVVLANPGFDVWKHGVQSNRLLTRGRLAGLAPPTNVDVPRTVSLPPFANGLYDPADTRDPDVGLRWMTARWRDDVLESGSSTALVGPDRLRRAAARERAEAWRLLYVALTRAREHLVLPLPRSLPGGERPRDRWLDALREGLAFSGEETDGYSAGGANGSPAGPFEVGVNDVDLLATRDDPRTSRTPDVAVTPPRRGGLPAWLPRFVNPSTVYPLTEDPDGFVLDHLLGRALHTATNDVDPDLPLRFDRLGPDDVGTCLHEVLTGIAERFPAGDAVRDSTPEIRRLFEETLREHAPRTDDREREELFGFFREAILEDFLASELWARIERGDLVAIERSVDGLVVVDDVEFEIHGTADFVLESPAGERSVVDAKIALAEPTPETRRRYELQVASYAYLFERHATAPSRSAPVSGTVETFGVERETVTSEWPPAVVERRLASLLDG